MKNRECRKITDLSVMERCSLIFAKNRRYFPLCGYLLDFKRTLIDLYFYMHFQAFFTSKNGVRFVHFEFLNAIY